MNICLSSYEQLKLRLISKKNVVDLAAQVICTAYLYTVIDKNKINVQFSVLASVLSIYKYIFSYFDIDTDVAGKSSIAHRIITRRTIGHRSVARSTIAHRSVVTPACLREMAEISKKPKIVLNRCSAKDIENINIELEKKGLIKRIQLEKLSGHILAH